MKLARLMWKNAVRNRRTALTIPSIAVSMFLVSTLRAVLSGLYRSQDSKQGSPHLSIAIARAMVSDPTLLVRGESTGDLDAQSAEEILQILSRLNHDLKKTILMATYDPRAARFAGVTQHLEKGRLLPAGEV